MKKKLLQNKWLLATIVASVIAVAAIVVAIVLGTSGTSSNEPERVFGVGEEGVYYYEVVDGTVVLTLRDGTFTLSGTINKTGLYSVDGSSVSLDFFKDEDGTATATLEDSGLALVYNDATLSFLKEVEYTVSFDVSGGSEISAVKVINGKTVAKPSADPVKENSVFLGWYTDDKFTTPFSFDEVAVKSDLTIYARWAERTIGVPDYVVSFELGDYDGAEKLAPLTTVSGVAYGIPTPERQGYTFGGWWISMYDDASKLTYMYKEGTVFTADTTLYAVWYATSSEKLNAPAVSVSGNMISWEAVNGASSYKLTITAPDGTVVIDNQTVTATMTEFKFDELAAGEYKISVVAVASTEDKNSDSADRYFANKTLDKVSGFYVENGILIFGAVENAQKYTITIDCGNDGHTHTDFDNGSSTTYYLANCQMQKGGIRITVTASGNGYASSVSNVFVYDKTLDAVEDLRYDAAGDKFVWTPVAGAANYKVTVTVGNNEYTFDIGTATSFSTAGFSGDITISVVPTTEGSNSPDEATASCKKTAPAAPNGLAASGNVISWSPVEGAVSYEVTIGTQTASTTETSIDISGTSFTLVQGQTYWVKVKAINASNESSSFSESIEVGYFTMSPVLSYSQNTVFWSPVLGVDQYQVRVNGGDVITVTGQSFAKVTLTQEGENLIEVRYVYGDTFSEWVSVTVTAFAVEYDTRTLINGKFKVEYLAVGDVMSLPTEGFSYDGYNFTGWYNAPKGAAGNGKLYSEGATFSGNAYTVVYAEWTPKSYSTTLNTEGLNFTVTNIANGAIEKVTYTKHFTLPVPVAQNTGMYFFAGWYTGPAGTGTKITDENGQSVVPYSYTRDVTLYPYYSTNALTFTLQEDNTYAVSKGETIGTVTNLKIPVSYNEIPVTVILENAFSSCTSIVKVEIPDTIKLVGTGAFNGCSNLTYIDVYVAKPDQEGQYETFYSSDNGVLIREDMGTTWLEFVPRAMTGEYTIPSHVEKILPKAFYMTKITKVTIPKTINEIPEYAFHGCTSLEEVVFEGGRVDPVSFVKNSFYFPSYNSKIASITLPAKMSMDFTTLKSVFNSLYELRSIAVEEGGTEFSSVGGILTDADKKTMLYCPRGYAGALTIPQGINTIGEYAFQYCDSITSVTIPVWVTTINKCAFQYCDGITSVVFKGSRSEDLLIKEQAFSCVYYMESLTFEGNGTNELDEGQIKMERLAFYGSSYSSKLKTVTIGDGVNIESLPQQAFQTQGNLREFNISDKAYIGAIGEKAFEKCVSLTSFTVPATVNSIDANAFNGCTKLTTLEFATAEGEPKLTVASAAFNGCTALTSIELPDRLDAFDASAFEGCTSLKAITVKNTNQQYLTDANGILYAKNVDENNNVVFTELLFYPKALVKENNGIINNLPSTLVIIGGSAFSDNATLKSIVIPAKVTSIGAYAFANCENLSSVQFSAAAAADTANMALEIGNYAFYGCKSLTNDFRLPSYTSSIGNSAFVGCKFSKFVIPEGVTSIGMAAFWGNEHLTEVEFKCTGELVIADGSANNDSKGGAFANCTALTRVDLPVGLTELGAYAFTNCYALETVNIGKVTVTDGEYSVESKLKRIGNRAFEKCVLIETIIIPKTVEAIGTYAFGAAKDTAEPGNGNLTTVIFEKGGTTILSLANYAFQYQSKLTVLNLPERTIFPTSTSTVMKDEENKTMKDANGNTLYHAPTADISTTYMVNLLKQIFTGCTSLAEVNIENNADIEGLYTSIDGVIYTADKTVLVFCPFANVGVYKNGEPTYELVIPNTVQMVLTYSINNCTKLKTVTFEEFDKADPRYGTQLLTIGNYTKLSSNKPTSSTSDYFAIGGPESSITKVSLPSHLKEISYNAFLVGTKVDEFEPMEIIFNLDAKNVVIDDYAFYYSPVKALALPGVNLIGTYAFGNATKLESLSFASLDKALKKLPDYVLYNACSLKSFVIPAQITEIGAYTFQKCAALTQIEIPTSVTKLGNYAFAGTGLTSVTLHSGLSFKSASTSTNLFRECVNLVSVTFLPNKSGAYSVTVIPNYTFYGCTSLSEINIDAFASKITEIGQSAFYKCTSLGAFDFTKFTALKKLNTNSFSYMTSFESIDLTKTKLTVINTAFNNLPNLVEIKLPETLSTALTSTSFTNDVNLERVYLTKSSKWATWISNVNNYIIQKSSKQVEIIIPEGHPSFYIDEFGVVYDPAIQTVYFASPYADLSQYTIPESVITIGDYAFAYNESLKTLVIPEGVTKIGKNAFYYGGIESVVIPSTVTEIGNYAFQHSELSKVTFTDTLELPSQLTNIAMSAFSYTKLVEVVIPDKVTTFGNNAFGYNDYLKSMTTGASMKEIPNGFVQYSSALEYLYIQEGIETIRWIFNSNYYIGDYPDHQLKSVHIPASVKVLESDAFCDMVNLKTVTFAEGSKLETIGKHAFRHCVSLETIEGLPAGVATIADYAFADCKSLKALDLSATGVTTIAQYAFQNTESMTVFGVPAGLTSIATYAFYNTGIENLAIPATVTTIGASAFENAALKTVTFPTASTITALGVAGEPSNIFKGTEKLETVTLPNVLKTIAESTFENSSVKTVLMADASIPSSLNYIGASAFEKCTNLEGFAHLEQVTEIGERAFFLCSSLENTVVSEGLTHLGAMAFGFCEKLTEAYIPASLAELGGNPYAGIAASGIKIAEGNSQMVIETDANGVITIYDIDKTIAYAVFGATGTYEILDTDSLKYAPGALAGNAITEANIPARFETVPDYLFMNCTELKTVTIAEEITEIGQYAFYNTALTTVTIPSTVTTINDFAFAYCRAIDNVVVPKTVTKMGNYLFAYCAALSNFEFEHFAEDETIKTQTVGTHFFYNCPNITQVVLPDKINITDEDKEANDASYKNDIPSYMFAGTGIVNAVIPATETDYYFVTSGVFADCKNLVSVDIQGYKAYSGTYGHCNSTYFDGCDKLEAIYIDSIDKTAYIIGAMANGNWPGVHIKRSVKDEATAELNSTAYFDETFNESFYIVFDQDGYADIIEYFEGVNDPWVFQVYDKDGNRLYCSETEGSIAYVEDAQGNVIWGEKPAN